MSASPNVATRIAFDGKRTNRAGIPVMKMALTIDEMNDPSSSFAVSLNVGDSAAQGMPDVGSSGNSFTGTTKPSRSAWSRQDNR
jgi:hypothetical protein